jgi:hypothetical protein
MWATTQGVEVERAEAEAGMDAYLSHELWVITEDVQWQRKAWGKVTATMLLLLRL